MPRALVTGYGGFIGSYTAPFLAERGYEVLGTALGHEETAVVPGVRTGRLDVRVREDVHRVIRDWRPDLIVHFAAQSMVLPSWEDPVYTVETNILGTLYLLEGAVKEKLSPVFLLAGSSAEYGLSYPEEIPIKEDKKFRPTSPYAASKVGAEAVAYAFFVSRKIPAITMHLFNVTGPGKAGDACADFASGIARLEKQGGGVLRVGNISSVRDISDVRDVVRAIWILVGKGVPGETYNICSGRRMVIADVLKTLVGMAKVPVQVVSDSPEKLRPFDEPVFLGDNSKLRSLGWSPEIPMEKTLSDMLDYWRGAG